MFRHAFSVRIIVSWLFTLAPVALPIVAPADAFAQFWPPLPPLPPLPPPLPPPPPAPNPLEKTRFGLRTEISDSLPSRA